MQGLQNPSSRTCSTLTTSALFSIFFLNLLKGMMCWMLVHKETDTKIRIAGRYTPFIFIHGYQQRKDLESLLFLPLPINFLSIPALAFQSFSGWVNGRTYILNTCIHADILFYYYITLGKYENAEHIYSYCFQRTKHLNLYLNFSSSKLLSHQRRTFFKCFVL